MKKALIIVLAMALLAGLGYIGVTESASAADNGSSSRGAAHDTVLVTIAEDLTLGHDIPFDNALVSDYINAESYRNFKLYAKMTPGPPPFVFPVEVPPPYVVVVVEENPLGEGLSFAGEIPFLSWQGIPWPPEERWTMIEPFEGLYSNIQVSVFNMTGLFDPEAGYDITIDLYLLMAKE